MSLDTARRRALDGEGARREEALALAAGDAPLAALTAAATQVRERFFGRDVSFCAIVNARSGACAEDCRYCAQAARYATGAPAYPLLDAAAVLPVAERMEAAGVARFSLVTSGPTLTEDELFRVEALLRALRVRTPRLRLCGSFGALGPAGLARLKAAGLARYHHNLETAERFFPSVCTTHDWASRIATLDAATEAGLEVCAGGLFGLGESWADRVDLALALRERRVSSVPVNFLTPIPGTPLGTRPRLGAEEALRILAIYRLLLPRATLRVCGGRPDTLGPRQGAIYAAGANALMTGPYLTTDGIDPAADRTTAEAAGMVVRPAPRHAGGGASAEG
jgi:biotin synthase